MAMRLSRLAGGRQLLARRIVAHAQIVAIGGVALQRADGDRFVDLAAPAVVLAGMRADAAQHIGKWIRRAGQQIGFLILRDPDRLHIAPAFRMDRTGGAAGNILVEVLLVRDRDGIAHEFPDSGDVFPLQLENEASKQIPVEKTAELCWLEILCRSQRRLDCLHFVQLS